MSDNHPWLSVDKQQERLRKRIAELEQKVRDLTAQREALCDEARAEARERCREELLVNMKEIAGDPHGDVALIPGIEFSIRALGGMSDGSYSLPR